MCKILYAISEDEKADRVLVKKSRDLNRCKERIMKDMGLAYTEKCAKCQQVGSNPLSSSIYYIQIIKSCMMKQLCCTCSQDSKNLRGTTAYNYILKRVANGILILEADVNELIQYSPFTEMNGAFQMQTKYVNRYRGLSY